MEDYKIPKEEIGRALAQFYNCALLGARRAARSPRTSRRRLTADFLKKNMCAPVEKKEGTLLVAVEDPYDLTRLDAIKAMNLAPRHDFVVALRERHPRLHQRAATARAAERRRRGAGPRPHHHGAGQRRGGRGRGRPSEPSAQPEIDETDSGIVKLANQIIIDAYNRGASDIHVEPYGKTAPTVVRFRIDGDCEKYLEIPPAHRNALVQRLKIMSKLDISEKRKPQDGKIRFKGPMGTIELRVATIPTSGGNEDVVMRILAASQAAAPREDGLLGAQHHRVQDDPAEALRHLPGGGPHRLGQDHDPALGPRASSTPWT